MIYSKDSQQDIVDLGQNMTGCVDTVSRKNKQSGNSVFN